MIRSTCELLGEAVGKFKSPEGNKQQISNHGISDRILTHIWDLDAMTQGLRRGSLVVLAGSTGMGKSTFALNIAFNISAYSKVPVAYGAYDSPPEELIYRLLASRCDIESGRIRSSRLTKDEWLSLGNAASEVKDLPLLFFDRSCTSLQDIYEVALDSPQSTNKNLGVLILDQLQLLPFLKSKRDEDIESLIIELRGLAEEKQLCVIILTQARPSAELRSDHRPLLNDLPAIDAMQAWTEVIAILHRDEYWNPESKMMGEAELIIAKNRDNPVGTIRFDFMPQYSRFTSIAMATQLDC